MGDRAGSVIESLGVYLPATVLPTVEVLNGTRKRVRIPLERLTGIRSRRTAGPDEFSIDLARKAIAECLALSRYQPADIELIVCATVSRDDGPGFQLSFEPSTSLRLKTDFGLDRAIAFDVSNACPGLFTAIAIVDAFIRTGTIRVGMVVSGEYITHLTRTAQQEIESLLDSRLACLTLGDSGAALILEASAEPDLGFHELSLYTAGKYADYCIGKPTDREHNGPIMYTDSVRLAEANVKHAIPHALSLIERHGWGREQLHHVIMHQTSRLTLKGAAREANRVAGTRICDDQNLINNLAERGNTATTSHFVALKDQILSGRINAGDNVAFGIAGSGIVVGTALYTLDDLPDRVRRYHQTGQVERSARPAARPNGRHPTRGVRIASLGTVPEGWSFQRDSVKLAVAAAEECLRGWGGPRESVDLLLNAGVYRSQFILEPANAAFIARDLELNHTVDSLDAPKTLAFDVFNGALGLLNACQVASELIRGGGHSIALIVTSEIENNRDLPGKPARGLAETGSALLLTADDDQDRGFGGFFFRYFPEYLDTFRCTMMQESGRPFLAFSGDPSGEARLAACIVAAVDELLASEGIDRGAIDVVIPPQVSTGLIERLRAGLGLPRATIVDAVWEDADLFTSSLPYGLRTAQRQGLGKPGDLGLIIAVGEGVQVGCALYRF